MDGNAVPVTSRCTKVGPKVLGQKLKRDSLNSPIFLCLPPCKDQRDSYGLLLFRRRCDFDNYSFNE